MHPRSIIMLPLLTGERVKRNPFFSLYPTSYLTLFSPSHKHRAAQLEHVQRIFSSTSSKLHSIFEGCPPRSCPSPVPLAPVLPLYAVPGCFRSLLMLFFLPTFTMPWLALYTICRLFRGCHAALLLEPLCALVEYELTLQEDQDRNQTKGIWHYYNSIV